MKVYWQEFYEPHHAEDYADWQPLPPDTYLGEVIGVVRALGETRLVVMLDGTGKVREVAASKVTNAVHALQTQAMGQQRMDATSGNMTCLPTVTGALTCGTQAIPNIHIVPLHAKKEEPQS